MLKITRVGMLDGDTLDVHFSNDNIMLLNMNLITERPEFRALLEDDRILYPKTDGDTVYWREGPILTTDEIIELVREENSESDITSLSTGGS